MAGSIYRRLTGRARSLGGYSQLWIAPTHILLLRSTRFREHYARFALADIQAVVITELPSRMPLQTALGAVAALWMFGSTLVSFGFAKGFFLVTGGIALAFAIADIARGPRCRCFLHTAVSREPLTPVGRMRVARKFLAQLQPAIEAVQGSVAMEHIQELEDRSSSQSLGGPSAAPLDQPPEIAQSPGYLPEIVFAMFLINAALILAGMLFRNAQVINVLPTTLFSEVLLVVVALFRRGSRDPRRYIYVLMLVALLGIGWDLVLLAQSFGRLIMAAAESQRGQPTPLMTTMPDWTAFPRAHAIIAVSWRAGAGLIGMVAAHLERPASPASRAPQPVTEPQPK
jgi:hypothetical protein